MAGAAFESVGAVTLAGVDYPDRLYLVAPSAPEANVAPGGVSTVPWFTSARALLGKGCALSDGAGRALLLLTEQIGGAYLLRHPVDGSTAHDLDAAAVNFMSYEATPATPGCLPDLNGDGVGELFFGWAAPFDGAPADPKAVVLSGNYGPDITIVPAEIGPLLAWSTPVGPADGASADFNGDGADDLAIALPTDSTGGRSSNGAVRVLLGPLSGQGEDLTAVADATLEGSASGQQYGMALLAGDYNGDGFADLAVASLTPLGIHVTFGPLTGTRGSDTADAWFPGAEINARSRGDLDGNGADDLAVEYGPTHPSAGAAVFYGVVR